MSLLDRHTGFVRALRHGGLPVSLAEGLDAARALTVLDLEDRETLRAAYAASLVKRHTHRDVFDTLFELWFPVGTAATTEADPMDAAPEEPAGAARAGEIRTPPTPRPSATGCANSCSARTTSRCAGWPARRSGGSAPSTALRGPRGPRTRSVAPWTRER